MILAGLYARDADALLCDLAQTYHVYSFDALPARTLAVLAAGLPEDSRVRRGKEPKPEILLLATAVDRLGLLFWAQTKDGARGVNRPKSVASMLLGKSEKPQRATAYATAEEFERARKKLIGENNG